MRRLQSFTRPNNWHFGSCTYDSVSTETLSVKQLSTTFLVIGAFENPDGSAEHVFNLKYDVPKHDEASCCCLIYSGSHVRTRASCKFLTYIRPLRSTRQTVVVLLIIFLAAIPFHDMQVGNTLRSMTIQVPDSPGNPTLSLPLLV